MLPALTKCMFCIWVSVYIYRYEVRPFMIYLYSVKYVLRKKRYQSAYKNVSKPRGVYRNKKKNVLVTIFCTSDM